MVMGDVGGNDGTGMAPGGGVGGGVPGGGGWGWRRALGVVLVLAVWGGVFFFVQRVVPGAKAERTWSAASGSPVPSDFVFLMFPVDENVPTYDSAGGKKVGLLERAMGNDYGELRNSQWVQVPPSDAAGKRTYVRVEDLRYLSAAAAGTAVAPPEGTPSKRINYVAAFAAAYRARSQGELRTATFMIYTSRPEALGREAEIGDRAEGRYVSLALKEGPNQRQFFAKVTAEKAVPLAIDRLSEGSRIQRAVLRWIIAGCVATVAAVLAAVLIEALRRRGQGVEGLAAPR